MIGFLCLRGGGLCLRGSGLCHHRGHCGNDTKYQFIS
jgi:hypothetical protein